MVSVEPSQLGCVATKPVLGFTDNVIYKPACSATETSKKIDLSLVASLDMKLSIKRIIKALIRLVCAFLFANPPKTDFLASRPNLCSCYLQLWTWILKQDVWNICFPCSLCEVSMCVLFVLFDSLRPINHLSVKQVWVFLGWTSTKLG